MAFLRGDQKYTLKFKAGDAVKRAGKGAAEGMKKTAKKLERGIKSLTPVSPSTPTHRGGNLKRSVTVKAVTRTKNPRFEVHTLNYGVFVENGTVNMDAQPFVRPIMVGQRKNWVRDVAREGKRVVNKGGKKRR